MGSGVGDGGFVVVEGGGQARWRRVVGRGREQEMILLVRTDHGV